MNAASPPHLLKHNKWTQYLRRDILMEVCELIIPRDEVIPVIPGNVVRAIVRNPGYDHDKYAIAFPHIKWSVYEKELEPLSEDELKTFVQIIDPVTRHLAKGANSFDNAYTLFESMMGRISSDQLRVVDPAVLFNMLECRELSPFVSNMFLNIEDAALALEHLRVHDSDDDVRTLAIFASRPDMTAAAARRGAYMISFPAKMNTTIGTQ